MKISRKQSLPLLIVTAIAVVTLALVMGRGSNDYAKGSPGPETTIVINAGDYGSTIAQNLFDHAVVKSSAAFLNVLASDSRGNAISPGAHRIHTHIPATQALEELLDPARNSGSLTVKEGVTYSDILGLLKSEKILPSQANPKPFLLNERKSLEGQLFPATYSFAPGTTSSRALSAMINKFQDVASNTGLLKGFDKYTPYQVLTVASMVQIEGDPSDYEKVARVIYNRLSIGMPLQLNSTVQYAANLRGRIALSRNATKIQSPFNTYIHTGLPPSPISNPGEAAIKASLNPVDGNWLYFITVKPHDTRFTNSFATFQEWVTQYNNNLANGAFK